MKRAPSRFRVVDGCGSAVGLGDGVDDGEPQAGTALVSAPCFVEAGESLEDAVPVLRGDAGAVLVTASSTVPACSVTVTLTAARAWWVALLVYGTLSAN